MIFIKENLKLFIEGIIENGNLIMILAALVTIFIPVFTIIKIIIKLLKFLINCIIKKFLRKNHNIISDYLTEEDLKGALKYYIPTRGQNIDPCNADEILDNQLCSSYKLVSFLMQNNFEKNRNRYYMILADSGMGKSTFLYKLYNEYNNKWFRTHDIQYIPLFSKEVFEDINKIDNKKNTILLLDALDENEDAINDHKDFLNKLVTATTKFHTTIITCRTQFFSSEADEPKYIRSFSVDTRRKIVDFKKIYISPFSNQV